MSQYRPELDALRGVAVSLVVLFHIAPPLLPFGGAVGVDVFFVLSGYLITGILLREWRTTGQVDLRAFYVRRIRRLFPGLLAMVGIVTLLAFAIGRGEVVARGGLLAIAYVGNTVSDGELLGPFRHTWSLAVGEQFYLAWPLVLILALRWRWAALLVLPLAVLPAFWALGFGVATALAGFHWRSRLGAVLSLAVILAGAVMGSGPVVWLAAAFLVSNATRWYAVRPLVWLGTISYAVYLWHYPITVSGIAAMKALGWAPGLTLLGIAALSVLAGWLSTRYVERPFRLHTNPPHRKRHAGKVRSHVEAAA